MALLLAAAGCSERSAPQSGAPPPAPPPADAAVPEAPTRARVVCLGDSLTAGLGLTPEQAYPALLQARLREAGLDYDVVNAGVSGDTSAGGLRRLEWSLSGEVAVLVLALGANDGLRGLPVSQLKANLGAVIQAAQAREIQVVLAGMEAPPNFGAAYTREFRAAYEELATEHRVALVPFFLDGVAGVPALNQADGIHPNAEGQRVVADTLWRALAPIVRARASS